MQLELISLRPVEQRFARPLLLLHGAWHGAWCWQGAMQDLARRGFVVHALSLRGHGASDRPQNYVFSGLKAYLADLRAAIAAIEPTPMVMGHSMGGFVLQHYLMSQRLPGAFLLCSMPYRGPGRFLAQWALHHPMPTIKTLLTLDNRHLVGTPALAHEAFLNLERPVADAEEIAAQLVNEPLRMIFDSLLFLPQPRRNRSPLAVFAAARDAIFTLGEQRALAEAYGAPFILVPEAGHDLMLDPAWQIVAVQVEYLARKWTDS
jgi:pimeloyl-ACP methyl ester carboxylesterase